MKIPLGWSGLGVGAVGVVVGIAVATIPARSQVSRADDVANVAVLLSSMRGTGTLACGLSLTVVEGNSWGNWGGGHQLTGDTRYAGLARQCVELALAGQRDRDDRYALVAPGGQLRAGPSLAWYALAYDLCYDAWPADFRATVATALMTVNDSDDAKERAKAAEKERGEKKKGD